MSPPKNIKHCSKGGTKSVFLWAKILQYWDVKLCTLLFVMGKKLHLGEAKILQHWGKKQCHSIFREYKSLGPF